MYILAWACPFQPEIVISDQNIWMEMSKIMSGGRKKLAFVLKRPYEK